MNMMMVKASMFPRTSFGIPWSSGRMISYWYEECKDWDIPIVPAWEMKLLNIWENALYTD
jgi:hypothetical protein